jgi:hypothetical protein
MLTFYSTKAEFIAIAERIKREKWINAVLKELGDIFGDPISILTTTIPQNIH